MLSRAQPREALKLILQCITKPLSWYPLASLNFSSFRQIRSFIEELEPHPQTFLAQKQTPKRKIPPPERVWRWDSRIARFMIRYLEFQPPGARRHTCTAGTTETSLHGLLDVVIHTEATLREKILNVKLIIFRHNIRTY